MTMDETITSKNVQYVLNREVAKYSTLSFGNVNKYEYRRKSNLKK